MTAASDKRKHRSCQNCFAHLSDQIKDTTNQAQIGNAQIFNLTTRIIIGNAMAK